MLDCARRGAQLVGFRRVAWLGKEIRLGLPQHARQPRPFLRRGNASPSHDMTQLAAVDPSEVRDALLFFAALEHRHLERHVEDRLHAVDYRTIVLACQALYSTIVLATSCRMLTHEELTTYSSVRVYSPAVSSRSPRPASNHDDAVDFGQKLEALRVRSGLTQMTIARRALAKPDDDTGKDTVSEANYLSRIERGGVPNLGLSKLRLLAKGYGFPDLGSFFAALDTPSLPSAGGLTHNPAFGLPKAGDHASSLSPVVDILTYERLTAGTYSKITEQGDKITAAVHGITTAVDRLARRLATRDQSHASARPPKSTRRRSAAARSTKSA